MILESGCSTKHGHDCNGKYGEGLRRCRGQGVQIEATESHLEGRDVLGLFTL